MGGSFILKNILDGHLNL